MITALIALAICGQELVIDDVVSSSSRVAGEGRVTLVQAAEWGGGGDEPLRSIARVQGRVLWEPSAALSLGVGGRVFGVLDAGPHTADGDAFFEPRVGLRWQGGQTEVALGYGDALRWSTLVDPLPLDLRLGPLPETAVEDRRRAIPFVSVRQGVGRLSIEGLWQPLAVQAAGVDVDGDARGLAGGAVGARAGWRGDGWGVAGAYLWRLATTQPVVRQHVIGLDANYTTGVVHWRAEVAWSSRHSDWLVGRNRRDRRDDGALEGLVSVGAAPTIFLDGELGVRARHVGEQVDALELFFRLELLMAFDGVLRLDAEGHIGLGYDDQQLAAALVVRASARAEVALGVDVFGGNGVDGGLGALYDATDQLWARVAIDF